MKRPIFIAATDFSHPAKAAFALAADFQCQADGDLYLLHIVEYPGVHAGVERRELYEERMVAEAHKKMEAWLEEINPPCQVKLLVQTGETTEQIIHIAKTMDADCIVAGTHGNNHSRMPFLGSVALGLLRSAEVPLLFVSTPTKLDFAHLHALVPVTREYGVRMVSSFLNYNHWKLRCSVDLVNVVMPDDSEEQAEHFLTNKVDELLESGLKDVEAVELIGEEVVDALVEFMYDPINKVDMVIAETRKHQEYGVLTVGSKLEDLILRSKKPVLCLSSMTEPAE